MCTRVHNKEVSLEPWNPHTDAISFIYIYIFKEINTKIRRRQRKQMKQHANDITRNGS